jgi:hypothetical protein
MKVKAALAGLQALVFLPWAYASDPTDSLMEGGKFQSTFSLIEISCSKYYG